MTKEEIKKIILQNEWLLKKYSVKSISLFGSYLRDEQREDSDIDFLVDFEKDTYDNFINLVFKLEELFKKDVQVLTTSDLSPYIKPYIIKEAETLLRGNT